VRKAVVLSLAAAVLAGCAGGARHPRWKRGPDLPAATVEAALPPLPPTEDQIPGTPPFRVTWEQLSRTRPGGTLLGTRAPAPTGIKVPPPEMKIVLLNASHPEAQRMRIRAIEGRSQRFEAEKAVVSDADMIALLQGLDQGGFFRYAEPTSTLASMFESERARGRITVERGGESVTLLAQYGQGQNPATRPIPELYANAKRAISVLKNRTPHLSVTQFRASDPRGLAPK
jgi:hypothetical protein